MAADRRPGGPKAARPADPAAGVRGRALHPARPVDRADGVPQRPHRGTERPADVLERAPRHLDVKPEHRSPRCRSPDRGWCRAAPPTCGILGECAMKVGKVMCTDVQLIHPDETLRHAAALMKEIDAGALPVGEDDKLVGMVT